MADGKWMLEMHEHANHAVPVPVGNVQQPVRPEKVRRPQLVVKEGFVTEEAFGYFEHAWKEYKTLVAVTTAVKQHLSSCLGEEVSTLLLISFDSVRLGIPCTWSEFGDTISITS